MKENLIALLVIIGVFPMYVWDKFFNNSNELPDAALVICPLVALSVVGIPVYLTTGSWLWVVMAWAIMSILGYFVYLKAVQ